ncbi:hypothetical protein DOU17_08640 [Clavibacter michiganensis subsp. michiganensis]|nr:hypothetical protein [Clavibacter michiganensis subsp. michiganensis]
MPFTACGLDDEGAVLDSDDFQILHGFHASRAHWTIHDRTTRPLFRGIRVARRDLGPTRAPEGEIAGPERRSFVRERCTV